MAGRHFSGCLILARTLARGSAWLTDIFAIVILSFVAQRWTETCGAVAPGLVGTVIALLVDSWQTVAFSSAHALSSSGVKPMKPGTTAMYDALSFALTLGGMASLLVSSILAQEGEDGDADYPGEYRRGDVRFRKSSMTLVSMWFLGAVICWRIGLALWAGIDWYQSHQQEVAEQPESSEVEDAPST
ncbi:hypothetical protein E4U55_002113 [Claviceps digitariae]|nr:hypothetical protein E4U55_002113 [Claviceps digitariae]